MATKHHTYKNWMTIGLVAGVLALSACSSDETPMETQADEATNVDPQTIVEEKAADTAYDDTASNDVAVASADDSMAVSTGDDVAVATAGEENVLDGTEDSEHVSTY